MILIFPVDRSNRMFFAETTNSDLTYASLCYVFFSRQIEIRDVNPNVVFVHRWTLYVDYEL